MRLAATRRLDSEVLSSAWLALLREETLAQ